MGFIDLQGGLCHHFISIIFASRKQKTEVNMKNIANFMAENKEHPMQEEVDNALDLGEATRVSLFKGLTLVAVSKGKGEYIFRAQKKKKRSQIKMGRYKKDTRPEDVSNAEFDIKGAIFMAQRLQDLASQGLDPVKELRSQKYSMSTTVDAVYEKVLADKKCNTDSTDAFERHYKNEIAPFIGNSSIKQIAKDDINTIINRILTSGRKSVADKCLYLCKNLFNYANEHNICLDITQKMNVTDHGSGKPQITGVALADYEIRRMFNYMNENVDTFSKSLYYLVILLVSLGLRKNELITAKWRDLDQHERLLHIDRKVAKNRIAIAIPISDHLQPLIDEVSKLSNNSEYIFPAFKKSSNGHMCVNTLNTALKRLFTKADNELQSQNIKKCTVHDLRRTFRTMLSVLDVPHHIAELCINHRNINSDELNENERYDRHAKLEQRRQACDQVAENILQLVEDDLIQLKEEDNIIQFRTAA